MTPVLSVITVCFNAAKTVEETVRSVVMPKAPGVEYIVIDGASSDGTLAKLQPFRQDIDVLVSEPDRGIYDAMTKGVAASSGEFVAFLNADDVYLPHAVDAMLAAIRAQGDEFDILYGDWLGVTGDGVEVERLAEHRWGARHQLCHQAMAVRRAMVSGSFGFDARYALCADFDLILRWGNAGARFRHLDRPLVRFSEAGASGTRTRQASLESLRIARERMGLLRALPFCTRIVLHFLRVTLTRRATS